MARTTVADVQTLLGESYSSSYSVTSFIETANVIVTKHCVDDDFAAAELELIERYVAAWAYCVSHPRATNETAKGVGQSLQHAEDLGFDSNEYGQMAKRLDWSGALAALDVSSKSGLRRTVELTWLGIPNDEATNEVTI
jgi:hypothetical protein